MKHRAVVMLEAGDWRVQEELDAACQRANIPLLIRPDPHFLCSLDDFNAWAGEKSSLRLEFFYRWQRKRHDILMADGEPVGGQWNFDADNRQSFGKKGPGLIPTPERFALDAMTREVMTLVEQHFPDHPDHPGQLANFAWPVTPEQARLALDDFIRHRLPEFGRWQDAMWGHEPFLWHSLLSTAMNFKLLDPRTVIAATLAAYQAGNVPLAAAEGFIRQILGWREFVRGIYWRQMPGLAEANQYDHKVALPDWFWTGKTNAACLAAAIGQTLQHGYAHHIQRLMITGNFALIAGIEPRQVADWYLAIYVDAVAWVEEPNTLGMALNAWPGMTSKPYCASGAYIKRMSNHCQTCRYQPETRIGDQACPFTTFYWDFLLRHEERFARNPRMALAVKNISRFPEEERRAIQLHAEKLRANLDRI
jgi:deoxyribodipyrimidine photolyase-related protein